MTGSRTYLLLIAVLCGQAPAQTEDWSCPMTNKVALLVRSPGWISGDTLNYPGPGRPTLRFARMRLLTHGPAAVCVYQVDERNELQFWRFGACAPLQGGWKHSGPDQECHSENPLQCVLSCTPK